MAGVDSMILLLPRPTTLVGATTFTTEPLDVSEFGSAQLQLWRGPIAGSGSPTILFYFEESLDAETWALGPSTPVGYDPADAATGGDPSFAKPQLFAYAFQLRWFRLRIVVTGTAPIVSCWCEGFLRDGAGGGSWTPGRRTPVNRVSTPMRPPALPSTMLDAGGARPATDTPAREAGTAPPGLPTTQLRTGQLTGR